MEKNKLYYMKQANFLIKKLAAICLFFHLLFLTLFITGSTGTGKVPGTELWYSTLRMRKMKMTTTKTKPTPTTYNQQPSFFNFQSTEFKIII